MKIGKVDIGSGVVFAPMAGFSDIGFRYLCRKYGADLTYTEMISAKGLMYNDYKTKELMATSDIESPVAVQLFGSDIDAYLKVIDKGYLDKFDIIDINMGCPVRKIVANGEGSAMMLNPKTAAQVVKAVKTANKPVTVKIRSGFDSVIAPQFAMQMQEAGADAITVHARTREQFYSGEADWNVISEVVKAVDIPVIGNGDVSCFNDIERMKDYTGCQGVMIARAALGNPYIFTGVEPKDLREDILIHIKLLLSVYNERIVANLMKKQLCFYSKHNDNAKAVRIAVNTSQNLEGIYNIVDEFY